jgi:hypothetical protein
MEVWNFQKLKFINLIREKSHIVGNVLLGIIIIYDQNISFWVVNKNNLNLNGDLVFIFWRDNYKNFICHLSKNGHCNALSESLSDC